MAIIPRPAAKRPVIDLAGSDGNAFGVMGYAKRYAKELGLDGDAIIKEMMAGDYDELIAVFDREFGDYVDIIMP